MGSAAGAHLAERPRSSESAQRSQPKKLAKSVCALLMFSEAVAHRVVRVGISDHHQRSLPLRYRQLLAGNLAKGQECRARRRTAVRAVAVERGDELVRDPVSDGIASAATPQHDNTLEEEHRQSDGGAEATPVRHREPGASQSSGPALGNSPEDVAAVLGTGRRGESARWPRKEILR